MILPGIDFLRETISNLSTHIFSLIFLFLPFCTIIQNFKNNCFISIQKQCNYTAEVVIHSEFACHVFVYLVSQCKSMRKVKGKKIV